MKKISFFVLLLVLSVTVFAQTTKTVNVTTAGTLNSLLSTSATTISTLTITGNIDARDFAFMRDNMTVLSVLDISVARIKAYTGIDGSYALATITYPADELPLCAFYNASTLTYKSSLTSIKLPTTLKSIGGSAFYYCYGLSGTFTIPATCTNIGSYALYGCSSLSAYVVETANTRYASNNGVLFNKKQDSLFICPSAKTGSYTIPSTVVSIGASAFDYCSGLTGSLTIPSSVKSIGYYAFYYCSGFTGNLTIPNSVTDLAEGAFYGCNGLSGTITIPKSVISIGSYAFFECNKIASFQVDALNTKYASSNDVLFNKLQDTLYICPPAKTGTYTIPSTVKGIGSYAFYNCSNLTGALSIPKTVGLIGNYAFYGCNQLTAYNVDALNVKYASNDGVLLNKNQDSLLVCPAGKTGSYSVPPTVKDIGAYSFYYCAGLTGSFGIPASVKSIGNYAFYGCNNITAFQIDALNTVYSDKDGVMFNKTQDSLFVCPVGKTGKYSIPPKVTAIDLAAFDGCSGLTEIEIPNSVTSIGNYAFEYCTGLTEIILPKNISTIGSGAFYSCTNLVKFGIQKSTPPTIDYYTLYLVDKTKCQLMVPAGSVIAYQISNYWKEFSSIVESSFTALNTSKVQPSVVYVADNHIVVNFLTVGDLITILSTDGRVILHTKAKQNYLSIPVTKSASYLVRINNKVTKVIL